MLCRGLLPHLHLTSRNKPPTAFMTLLTVWLRLHLSELQTTISYKDLICNTNHYSAGNIHIPFIWPLSKMWGFGERRIEKNLMEFLLIRKLISVLNVATIFIAGEKKKCSFVILADDILSSFRLIQFFADKKIQKYFF